MPEEPAAVALALAHLEAWTNHDFDARLFPSAQTWQLDDDGKIKTERIVSISRPA